MLFQIHSITKIRSSNLHLPLIQQPFVRARMAPRPCGTARILPVLVARRLGIARADLQWLGIAVTQSSAGYSCYEIEN